MCSKQVFRQESTHTWMLLKMDWSSRLPMIQWYVASSTRLQLLPNKCVSKYRESKQKNICLNDCLFHFIWIVGISFNGFFLYKTSSIQTTLTLFSKKLRLGWEMLSKDMHNYIFYEERKEEIYFICMLFATSVTFFFQSSHEYC